MKLPSLYTKNQAKVDGEKHQDIKKISEKKETDILSRPKIFP
jgi:hypothetical protein